MVVAVAKAMEEGAQAIMCASTGNTSASAAAYAGRYGLALLRRHARRQHRARQDGAERRRTARRSSPSTATSTTRSRLAREITSKHPIALVNSVNPHRIEGQKTASFEIADALGEAPDVLALPVGNAGNITAYWRGFVEYHRLERTGVRPRMLGFQAAGAAPLVHGAPVKSPQTVASAIRIGNPASWKTRDRSARRVRRQHRGRHRRRDPRRLPPPRARRRHLLRARVGGVRRRRPQAEGRGRIVRRQDRRLHHHRQRPQGPRDRARTRTEDPHGEGRPADHRARDGLGVAASF